MNRAAMDVNTLLRIVLLLVIAWLVLEVLQTFLHLAFGIFRFLPGLLALAVIVLIVLWLLDRL